jgi:YD repeat-containing protein
MATRLMRAALLLLLPWLATIAFAQSVTDTYNANGQVATASYYNGTTITYTYDGNGNRLSAVATADTTPPSAPGTETDSNLTSTSATVSWAAATDTIAVTGYAYQVNGGAWSSFSSSLSANLTGLAPGTTYTVEVEAQDAAGNIGAPTSVTFTTPPGAPGTPTATNVTGTTATVSWTAAAAANGITGYSYQVNGGAWSSFSNVLSVSLTGLSYGTTYTVAVEAQDVAGTIGAAATGSFTTIAATPPSAPGTPVASSITSSSATVSWTAATDAIGVTGYSYQLNGGAWSAFSNILSVNLADLTYNTAYTIAVRAESTAGSIGPSSTSSFTTAPDNTPPSAPGALTFSNITGSSATVSWTAATDSVGVTGYSYEINGGSWSSFSNVLSVNLAGLANYTSYTVGVRAQDTAGNIGPTSIGTFKTLDAIPPSAPGTPTGSSITSSSATVSWTAAADAVGVTGYSYQVNGGAWSAFSNVLSVNLTGLASYTTYTIGVRAQDTVGNIGPTATGSFTTAYATSQSTLTAGQYEVLPYLIDTGYCLISSTRYGSMSPLTVSGALSYYQICQTTVSGTSNSYLEISGFTANPGQGWLISLKVATAATKTGSSATYSYSGGTATWLWTGLIGIASGTVVLTYQ